MTRLDIFVSSAMNELASERAALFDLLPKLGQGTIQLRPWVFEHSVKITDKVSTHTSFMDALQDSALCIVLFGKNFGAGTKEEFDHAVKWDIPIHIYVKEGEKSPELQAFLEKQTNLNTGFSSYFFNNLEDLRAAVTRSTQRWMREFLRNRRTEERAFLTDDFDDISTTLERVIGRDGLITELMEKLKAVSEEGAARILLQGFGGSGKTMLAMEIAKRWIGRQAQAILWYVVGSSDADELYEGLLKGLDIDEKERNRILNKVGQDQVNSIRKAIKKAIPYPTLIVLDNAWNHQGLTGLLKAFPSDIPVLITSRSYFEVGERIKLNNLTETAALELLGKHAEQDYSNDAGAKALCKYLDYLPFCIRIAGMNLKRLSNITPTDYLERIRHQVLSDEVIDHNSNQLGEQDPAVYDSDPDFLDRRSLRQLLDANYQDLPQEAREVFLAAGAFSIPQVTPAMLAAYLGKKDEKEVIHPLEILQARGLIDPINKKGHFARHYSLHNFSFNYLKQHYYEEKSVEAVQKTAIDACIAYMERYQYDAEAVDDEIDNILGAAQLALQLGADEKLVRLIELFTGFNGYIETRGHSTRTRRLLQQTFEDAASLNTSKLLKEAYDRAVKANNSTAASLLGGRIGETYLRNGDMQESIQQLESARLYAEQAGDNFMLARILRLLGQARLTLDPPDPVFQENLNAALRLSKENNYPVVAMKVHESWGHYYGNHGQDYARSEAEFRKAIRLCKKLNDNNTLFYLKLSLGGLKSKQDNLKAAQRLYAEAKLLAETVNSQPRLGFVHQGFWEIADARDKRKDAQRYLSDAITNYLQAGLIGYLMNLSQTALGRKYPIAPQQMIEILNFLKEQEQAQGIKSLACSALALYTADADQSILSKYLQESDIRCS